MEKVAALFSGGCFGASCETIRSGLAQNRIYLGRFNLTVPDSLGIHVGTISGDGAGVLDPVEGLARLSGAVYNPDGYPAPMDPDGDGWADGFDNCPSAFDPDRTDTDENGIGDECECGDQSGDGTVDLIDIMAVHEAIFERVQASPLCDTNNDLSCNVSDMIGVYRKIFGVPAYCSRYPPPGP